MQYRMLWSQYNARVLSVAIKASLIAVHIIIIIITTILDWNVQIYCSLETAIDSVYILHLDTHI